MFGFKIQPPCSPPWSPTREHFNGVDFQPPVLGIHRSYTCTNKICAIDPSSHCLPGIFYKRKNILDNGHVVGIRTILENEDIRNIYIFFIFSFLGLSMTRPNRNTRRCFPSVYPVRDVLSHTEFYTPIFCMLSFSRPPSPSSYRESHRL